MPTIRTQLKTARLQLRPTHPQDAERALEILSKANEDWFANHTAQWLDCIAYRFSIMFDDKMIGLTNIDEVRDGSGSLGYWLDEAYWGRGYAKEAAYELTRFGFEDLKLRELRSAHASDNVASGKILTALGFQCLETATMPSLSRKVDIEISALC